MRSSDHPQAVPPAGLPQQTASSSRDALKTSGGTFGLVGAAAACAIGCCSLPLLISGAGVAGGSLALIIRAGALIAAGVTLAVVLVGLRLRRRRDEATAGNVPVALSAKPAEAAASWLPSRGVAPRR